MITEGEFEFGLPTILNSNTATVSPYVHDAGADKILFRAGRHKPKVWFRATVTADANPSIKVDLLAADDAALTTNAIVLGSSGVIAHDTDGTALASGDTVERTFEVGNQVVAKRYYGLMVTLGGTNPDLAASQKARLVRDAQTNMIGPRAAIPA